MPTDETTFRTELLHQDGSVVMKLTGELDIATAPLLRQAAAKVIDPHLGCVTLDLSELTFVDTTGLQSLADVANMTAGPGADFQLQAVTDLTLRVIRLAGFNELEQAASPSEATSPQL